MHASSLLSAQGRTRDAGDEMRVRTRMRVWADRDVPGRAWLLHASGSHAGAVTAFRCDRQAIELGCAIAIGVPEEACRHGQVLPRKRQPGASASRECRSRQDGLGDACAGSAEL